MAGESGNSVSNRLAASEELRRLPLPLTASGRVASHPMRGRALAPLSASTATTSVAIPARPGHRRLLHPHGIDALNRCISSILIRCNVSSAVPRGRYAGRPNRTPGGIFDVSRGEAFHPFVSPPRTLRPDTTAGIAPPLLDVLLGRYDRASLACDRGANRVAPLGQYVAEQSVVLAITFAEFHESPTEPVLHSILLGH